MSKKREEMDDEIVIVVSTDTMFTQDFLRHARARHPNIGMLTRENHVKDHETNMSLDHMHEDV